jgi:hypothetical protein
MGMEQTHDSELALDCADADATCSPKYKGWCDHGLGKLTMNRASSDFMVGRSVEQRLLM